MEVTLQDVATQVAAIARQLERLDLRVDREAFQRFENRLTQQAQAVEELKQQAQANVEELKQQAHANAEDLKQQAHANAEDLKQQARQHHQDLKEQARIYRESLRDEVRLAAEGYGATLERIERELADLNAKFDIKFTDHDRVLTDHNRRITKLESR
jgi:cell division septum initiation protein DivIVA